MRPPRAVLAVSVVIVVSGCLGFGGGPPPSDPGAVAVVDEAATHSSSVESYRMSGTLRVVAEADGETRRITVDIDGSVNRSTRRLAANTSVDGEIRRTFVEGNTTYTECGSPWSGWAVETDDEAPQDWTAGDPLGRQVALLEESPVYWAGNETIDGVDVHVIEARPSGETLERYADRRHSGLLGPSIEDATLTAYIAEDSGRVVRTELAFGVTDDGASADASMTTRFRDHGTSIPITIPDAAREGEYEFGCPGS